MNPLRDTRTWRLDPVPEPLRWWEWLAFAAQATLVAGAIWLCLVASFILAAALGIEG